MRSSSRRAVDFESVNCVLRWIDFFELSAFYAEDT